MTDIKMRLNEIYSAILILKDGLLYSQRIEFNNIDDFLNILVKRIDEAIAYIEVIKIEISSGGINR